MMNNPQRTPLFDVQGFVRKYVPFTGRFIAAEKSGPGQWVLATFPTPNVDASFTIALGSIPGGYLVYQKSVAGTVYNGANQGSDWTANKIVLRASAAGTYRLWVST